MENLNTIIKDEKLLKEQLHNHTLTGSYLSLSIKILNRKKEVLIGKTIEEVVKEVINCDEIVSEFAVATEKNKNTIVKIEDLPYNGISGTKGMDEYMIETNSNHNKKYKSKNGFHKIVNRFHNDTGFVFQGKKEQIPVFQRVFITSK